MVVEGSEPGEDGVDESTSTQVNEPELKVLPEDLRYEFLDK